MTEQMLRDIETNIDGTVPYYVPTLIAAIRTLQADLEDERANHARERACRERNWNDLKQCRIALDTVCRCAEQNEAVIRAALRGGEAREGQ